MKAFAFYDKENNLIYHVEIGQLQRFCNDEVTLDWLTHGFGCGTHSSWTSIYNEFDNVETILTKEQFDMLANRIPITKEGIKAIIEILNSEENEQLLNKIVDQEILAIKEKYSLEDEDIKELKMDYDIYYLDRNCVAQVFKDYEELGRYIIEETYNIPRELHPYFDYEDYGYDVVNEESQYINLVDGRIIEIYS